MHALGFRLQSTRAIASANAGPTTAGSAFYIPIQNLKKKTKKKEGRALIFSDEASFQAGLSYITLPGVGWKRASPRHGAMRPTTSERKDSGDIDLWDTRFHYRQEGLPLP